MAFSQDTWNQLRATTADELIAALKADGYQQDPASRDATIAYIKYGYPTSKRIVIHYHPGKTYRPKLLKALLTDAGWTTDDALARVGLIKQKKAEATIPSALIACKNCEKGVMPTGAPCPQCGGMGFLEIPAS